MMDGAASLPSTPAPTPPRRSVTILCVDDEPNILSSLRRLFRAHGYLTLIAESGTAGLKILETEEVDLVISDMRMPEMDGACFLEHVRMRSPATIRLLLTGHADIQSILNAINCGEIYRYITKPWDDHDIVLTVRLALERQALEREKQDLEALTRKQNESLKALNASLEFKVQERTIELNKALDSLVSTNEKLRTSFLTSIKVFSSLIEMRGGTLAGHSRRVADVARRIAAEMGMDEHETQEIFLAGLLHNIGKIGFSDALLAMPVSAMKGENLGAYRKYPVRGEQLLMSLDDLRGAAALIRSHQERFDGMGFPYGLSGFNIPCGSRILALASDYENLQHGVLVQRSLRPEEAKIMILQNPGIRYDPKVVTAFKNIMGGRADDVPPKAQMKERVLASLAPADLKPGMVVARDLFAPDGLLLLSANHTLSARLILQMQEYQVSTRVPLTVFVDLG